MHKNLSIIIIMMGGSAGEKLIAPTQSRFVKYAHNKMLIYRSKNQDFELPKPLSL